MKATEGKIGRVFILRLEDNDKLPDCIEEFAKDNDITNAYVSFIAGIKTGKIVTGPKDPAARPVETLNVDISDTHESAAVGIIARDTDDNPILHIHGFLGRDGNTVSGCLRNGVDVWVTGEAIIYEILDATCVRVIDQETGFKLLNVGERSAAATVPAADAVSPAHMAKIDLNDGYSHIIHLFNSSLN